MSGGPVDAFMSRRGRAKVPPHAHDAADITGLTSAIGVFGGNIVAGTIEADKLNVNELAAITASMGDLSIDGTLTLAPGGSIVGTNLTITSDGDLSAVNASISGSLVLAASSKGAAFPTSPDEGMLFFRTDLKRWYWYDGTDPYAESGWISLDWLDDNGRIDLNLITADKLSVTTLDAVTASMGDLTIDGTLTLSTGGSIVGTKLTIASDGAITATGASISGTVTATSGTIGGWSIGSGYLASEDAYIYIGSSSDEQIVVASSPAPTFTFFGPSHAYVGQLSLASNYVRWNLDPDGAYDRVWGVYNASQTPNERILSVQIFNTGGGTIHFGDSADPTATDVTGYLHYGMGFDISNAGGPGSGMGSYSGLYLSQLSTGDVAITLEIDGVTTWWFGIDNSDADSWKLGTGSTAFSTPFLKVSTAGVTTFGGNVLPDGDTRNFGSSSQTWLGGYFYNLYDEGGNLRWDLSGNLSAAGRITGGNDLYLGSAAIIDASATSIRFSIGGTPEYYLAAGVFRPISNGADDLGGGSFRWNDIYAVNDVIQTSDETQKHTKQLNRTLATQLLRGIRPIVFRWKGGGKRRHHGFSAQQIIETLDSLGIDTADFAAVVDPSVNGDEGPLGLRQGELVPVLWAAAQQLDDRLTRLEGKVA